MYPVVRVTKRVPDGSVWQRYRAYRLSDLDGAARVYLPPGTRWWNPLGGWVTADGGVAVFRADLPFAISCHGPDGAKRFYIDVVLKNTIGPELIEYLDLYLDVMIDAARVLPEN